MKRSIESDKTLPRKSGQTRFAANKEASRRIIAGLVLFVADLFHPVDVFASRSYWRAIYVAVFQTLQDDPL
ncbi:MAG: hypothetical protein WCB99_00080 [Candidatus Cybelea sp.]|jgi:hypothetical protein